MSVETFELASECLSTPKRVQHDGESVWVLAPRSLSMLSSQSETHIKDCLGLIGFGGFGFRV